MANKFKIGDLEVLVVSDGKAVVPGTMYFRASTPERWNFWWTPPGPSTFSR